MRAPTFVTLTLSCLCLAGMGIGVLIAFSPFLVDGGVVGWSQGYKYDPSHDILLLKSAGGLVYGLLSVGLGIVVALVSGFVGVWLGIASAILGLAKGRAGRREGPNETEGSP